jgi:hypothetical protein
MSTFTKSDLATAYAIHGDRLVWLGEDGGIYSANPNDYFQYTNRDRLPGTLAVRIPERYEPINVDDEETP